MSGRHRAPTPPRSYGTRAAWGLVSFSLTSGLVSVAHLSGASGLAVAATPAARMTVAPLSPTLTVTLPPAAPQVVVVPRTTPTPATVPTTVPTTSAPPVSRETSRPTTTQPRTSAAAPTTTTARPPRPKATTAPVLRPTPVPTPRTTKPATPPAPVPPPPAASDSGAAVAAYARKLAAPGNGIPYVWGGKSLAGFDCSGFVWYVLNHAGLSEPYRASGALAGWVRRVSAATARPGDLVFWPGHVGIYLGDGMMADAGNRAVDISIRTIHSGGWFGRIPA